MVQSSLSPSQISRFLTHIALPEHLHNATPSLALLNVLHVHMLAACPYENLSIHYSPSHKIIIDPQHVLEKILTGRGRGGYCMELAILYNHVLRGLGFAAYTAGVRTRPRLQGVPQGDYPGWVHIVNIVTLPASATASSREERYHVDVAFGGDGPTAPLALVAGRVHRNLGAQEVRLVRDWISTQVHRTEEAKLWIYQYRNGVDRDWNSFYAFPELEFMAADWEVCNWWTGSNELCWQTFTVLIVKFLGRAKEGGKAGEQEIYGKRMLVDGVVKENVGGKTTTIAVCETEAERVAALDKYFGVKLTEEEALSIRGWVSDLNKQG
jgi:arylamine N-acetyltransferase